MSTIQPITQQSISRPSLDPRQQALMALVTAMQLMNELAVWTDQPLHNDVLAADAIEQAAELLQGGVHRDR